MSDPFLDFLSSALVPELGSNVAACSSGDVHFILIPVSAVRALPYQFVVFIFHDLDFAFIAAFLTVVGFGIQFGIHNVVVDMADQSHNSRQVVFHVWNFHVGDGSARGQFLELRFEGQLGERIDWLSDVNMVGVGDVVFVSYARDDAEAFLQFDSIGVPYREKSMLF